MKLLLGASYGEFLNEYEKTPSRALRMNGIYSDPAALDGDIPFALTPVPFDGGAFYFEAESDERPGSTALHHAGAFYIQEPSAMSPLSSVDIKEDAKILDICASPGGKSIQAAMKARNGVIVSNEIVPSRAATLMGNIERMGIRNAIVTNTDSDALASWYRGVFNLVICDAPCSGEGMFRKNPLAVSEWSPENVKMCAERQRVILDNAAKTVAEGGYLLYSTCTFSLEENEMQVDSFLTRHPGFSLCEVRREVKDHTADGVLFDGCAHGDITKCRRFYPHISRGEGQFFALMQRNEAVTEQINHKNSTGKLTAADEKTVSDFLKENVEESGNIALVGKTVSLAPDFPVPPFSVYSAGVKVGEVQKGRVVPHHQFFSALGQSFVRKTELDEAQIVKYLAGETFAADAPDGWCAVTVKGIPLGGAKAVSGTVKNHYPKGLRVKK